MNFRSIKGKDAGRRCSDAWRGTCGRGGRLLLVETSALPRYDRTRAFYARCGYEEEARIRDYLAAGDDLVVFRKDLNVD